MCKYYANVMQPQHKYARLFWMYICYSAPPQSILLTKTFALISRSVHKDFGRDDVAKRQEHLHELCISKLLGEVINKQVATFWPCQ